MKKYFINAITVAVCVIAILPLFSSGCSDEQEMNVGYHHINIPKFTEADYLQMLNSTDNEIQYNAICNLGKNYNKVLTTDSLKGTPEYDSALIVYQKIFPLMDSKNTWVSSAAIAFIKNFAYNRSSFVQYVLKNNNPSLNVQMEMIMDIAMDTTKDGQLLTEKINFLRKQPSWLLQNGRYLLINKSDQLSMNIFMMEYDSTNEEYKKLLILGVLTEHINDSVFSFLTKEYEATRYDRIKKMIVSNLPEADNPELVLQWFGRNYNLLEENMVEMMANLDSKNEIYSKLIVQAIEKGWNPSLITHEKDGTEYAGEPLLYLYLFLNKYENIESDSLKYRQNATGKRIEDFLLKDQQLKKGWLAFEKRMLKYPLPQDLINQHRLLTETYLKQSQLLMQKFQIDTAIYTEFIKGINLQAKELYEERVWQKE